MRCVYGLAALALLIGVACPAAAQSASAPPRLGAEAALSKLPELPAPPLQEENFRVHYGHDILITGTPEFIQHVSEVLDQLALLPTGAAILEAVGADAHHTVIAEFSQQNATVQALNRDEAGEGLRRLWGRGEGTDALLSWNPEFDPQGFSRAVIMGHELIHAIHYNRGEVVVRQRRAGPNQGTALEELITIGTDGYEDRELTENQLRLEWNELYPEWPLPPARYGHGYDFQPHDSEPADYLDAVVQQPQPLLGERAPAGPPASAGLRGALEGTIGAGGAQ